MTIRRLLAASTAALTLAGLAVGAPADAKPSTADKHAPVPTLVGPIGDDVGIKGEAWFDPPFVLEEVEPIPYVSEEFFLDGTATAYLADGQPTADYVTRMLVVRPADEAKAAFSGTVVMEWDNVTAQAALNPLWIWDHPYLLREGHAFVSVSAQKVGVDGASPLAHVNWDPERYGSLVHPGDDYSYDIFAQAAEAIDANAASTDGETVLGDLPVQMFGTGPRTMPVNIIATGTSQSGSRLHTYLNRIQGDFVDTIDGILLDAGGSRTFARPPVVPTVHFLSEDGLSASTPSAAGESLMGLDNLYRLWEVPGASHADAEFSRYIEGGLYGTHILETPEIPWAQWDARRYHYRYGDEGVGTHTGCQPLGFGDNTYPRRYAARAAMDQLIRWVDTTSDRNPRNDVIPGQPDRVLYDATGQPVRDDALQIVGGVRLPQIDVPIADYLATTCGLFGQTVSWDNVRLFAAYPTTADYVAQMDAAIERALAAGSMLAPEAEELRFQLASAVVPLHRAPEVPSDVYANAAHFAGTLMGRTG